MAGNGVVGGGGGGPRSGPTGDLNRDLCTPPFRLQKFIVSAGAGWPGMSVFGLGEIVGLICICCLSVAARRIVQAGPKVRGTVRVSGTSVV